MGTQPDTNDVREPWTGTRRGDGGVYLMIVDGSDEQNIAAYYAAKVAQARRANIAIAHITDVDEFIHWGKVEAMMKNDLRAQAEKDVWQVAKDINNFNARLFPSLYIREGKAIDKIHEIIDENQTIRALILAGSKNGGNQGPLVSHFSNKGMTNLRVPVIIVPGHLDNEAIDAIT